MEGIAAPTINALTMKEGTMRKNINKALYECDRCHAEFWHSMHRLPAELIMAEGDNDYRDPQVFDLCDKCAAELKRFFTAEASGFTTIMRGPRRLSDGDVTEADIALARKSGLLT